MKDAIQNFIAAHDQHVERVREGLQKLASGEGGSQDFTETAEAMALAKARLITICAQASVGTDDKMIIVTRKFLQVLDEPIAGYLEGDIDGKRRALRQMNRRFDALIELRVLIDDEANVVLH